MIVNRDFIIQSCSFLVYLLPFALLSGPFIPDLILTITSIVFLIISIKEKSWKYFNNKFFIFFLIFYFYILLRSIFSINYLLSLESSLFYIRFILFSLTVWFLIENNNKFRKLFFISLVATFIILIIFGFVQYYSIVLSDDLRRLTLIFNDKKSVGSFLSRLMPLIFALAILLFEKKRYVIFLCYFLLILTDVSVFLSGERTAMGLLLIFTLLVIFLSPKMRLLRIITLIFSLIIIFSITILDPDIKQANIDRTIKQMNLDTSSNEMVLYSTEHDQIYRDSLKMFYENPIFGVGPKLYRFYCNEGKYDIDPRFCSTHPHNIYLQVLSETGLLGFIFLISILAYLIAFILRDIKNIYFDNAVGHDNYRSFLVISFFLTLFPFLPSNSLFNNWINIIYFLPVGFFLHSIYNFNRHPNNKSR
tara:strand:+ start:1069 stop:2325 length:1257 start_codon:yes stop_codon:yes gene_type:complete